MRDDSIPTSAIKWPVILLIKLFQIMKNQSLLQHFTYDEMLLLFKFMSDDSIPVSALFNKDKNLPQYTFVLHL